MMLLSPDQQVLKKVSFTTEPNQAGIQEAAASKVSDTVMDQAATSEFRWLCLTAFSQAFSGDAGSAARTRASRPRFLKPSNYKLSLEAPSPHTQEL